MTIGEVTETITVQREEFERDPLPWFRQASATRQVVVMRGETVSCVIGGSMAVEDERDAEIAQLKGAHNVQLNRKLQVMNERDEALARVAQLEAALRFVRERLAPDDDRERLQRHIDAALASPPADKSKCVCGEPARHQSGWCGLCTL